MAEPTTTAGAAGLFGLFVTVAGPLAGPYYFVLFGATLGAATALSAQPSQSTLRGIGFLVRVVCTSLLFTGPITALLQAAVSMPVDMIMGGVAYTIGWRWDMLSESAWPWLLRRVGIIRDGGAQ